MARPCTICARPDAGTIGLLLAEGRSVRSVAIERGLSEDALLRHSRSHGQRGAPGSPPTGAPARSARRPPPTAPSPDDPLAELVTALRDQALAGNPAIVHQYRLALQAQAEAKHAAPPQRELASEPEWIALRGRILAALEPFPAARMAVIEAIGAAAAVEAAA